MTLQTYRSIDIVGTDLTYEDMVDYVDSAIVSGVQIRGAGGITVTTAGGITTVDGTHLIAEDNDTVDGGTLSD